MWSLSTQPAPPHSGGTPNPTQRRPLFELWPKLELAAPFVRLGELPTPVGPLEPFGDAGSAEVFVKRDDLTSVLYGGNKMRTLEGLFGLARRLGATHAFSTGAYGSNHALATVLHAPAAGLEPGAILFPQPCSKTALANLRVTVSQCGELRSLPHWSALPLGMWLTGRSQRRRGRRPFIMVPGGAVPFGALGYVSAGLEVGEQVQRGELARPRWVVVAVGSTCTTAGLMVGFSLAARRGIGFVDSSGRPAPPRVCSVRVTPWPVTSAIRIVSLAARTSELVGRLAGDPSLSLTRRELASLLVVDGSQLGKGYGHPTRAGLEAIELFRAAGGPELDTTYSAKSAAALIEMLRRREPGPFVYWATKSSAVLPPVPDTDLTRAPAPMRRWMRRAAGAPSP